MPTDDLYSVDRAPTSPGSASTDLNGVDERFPTIAEHVALVATTSPDTVIIDSGANHSVFSNTNLLCSVRPAASPLRIRGLSGIKTSDTV